MGSNSGVPDNVKPALKRALQGCISHSEEVWRRAGLLTRLKCVWRGHKWKKIGYGRNGDTGLYYAGIYCRRCGASGGTAYILAVSSYAVAARVAVHQSLRQSVTDIEIGNVPCESIPHCSSGVGAVLQPPLRPRQCMDSDARRN